MLHRDLTSTMSTQEIIELAYAEFSHNFDAAAEFEIRKSADDGGKLLEFFVADDENATFLREELPPFYNGLRTIVLYRVEKASDGD